MAYRLLGYRNQRSVIAKLRKNFTEIVNEIQRFSFTKMRFKMSSAKWWPFSPGGDGLFTGTQSLSNVDTCGISPGFVLGPVLRGLYLRNIMISSISIAVIFFRGCVPDVIVLSYTVGYKNVSRRSCVVFLLLLYSLTMCANIEYIMARWSYSFVCTLKYLIIIIMQTYLNVLHFWIIRQVHSLECVFKVKSILLIIFHAIHGALCIRFTHFSYDDCENKFPLS